MVVAAVAAVALYAWQRWVLAGRVAVAVAQHSVLRPRTGDPYGTSSSGSNTSGGSNGAEHQPARMHTAQATAVFHFAFLRMQSGDCNSVIWATLSAHLSVAVGVAVLCQVA